MHYAISDIHGNTARLASILDQIQLQEEDTLYVIGDVVDRHSDGIRMLLQFMEMPNVKMILGNHEYMMLRALGYPYDGENITPEIAEKAWDHWYRNGGEVTFRQWSQQSEENQGRILAYLRNLPIELDVQIGNTRYKLAHAAPPQLYDGDPKYRNPAYFSIWRRYTPEEVLPIDYTLLFGHTPTKYFEDKAPMEVWYGQNRICIDCGSGYPDDPEDPKSKYGRLACLRLEDGKIFYSKVANT